MRAPVLLQLLGDELLFLIGCRVQELLVRLDLVDDGAEELLGGEGARPRARGGGGGGRGESREDGNRRRLAAHRALFGVGRRVEDEGTEPAERRIELGGEGGRRRARLPRRRREAEQRRHFAVERDGRRRRRRAVAADAGGVAKRGDRTPRRRLTVHSQDAVQPTAHEIAAHSRLDPHGDHHAPHVAAADAALDPRRRRMAPRRREAALVAAQHALHVGGGARLPEQLQRSKTAADRRAAHHALDAWRRSCATATGSTRGGGGRRRRAPRAARAWRRSGARAPAGRRGGGARRHRARSAACVAAHLCQSAWTAARRRRTAMPRAARWIGSAATR